MPVHEMNHHIWTKENVKKLLSIWDTKNMLEISQEMGLDQKQVNYMAHALRKKGFPLSQKRVVGKLQVLLEEVAGELGITLTK